MNSLDFGGTAHLIYEYGYFKDKKISVGCGGSLANTLFWLNFFKNKVLIRGILGDDNLGKILNELLERVLEDPQLNEKTKL